MDIALALLLGAIIYAVPFYIFRCIYKKPLHKLWSFVIVCLYGALAHVTVCHIAYGFYPYGSYPPVLWMIVAYYFLVAQKPILVPKPPLPPYDISNETETLNITDRADDAAVADAEIEASIQQDISQENNTNSPAEISSSPDKNILSVLRQSSYTKREKIISTVALILFGVCCILGYNIYSLQTNITAYQNKIQKYEKTLECRADYGQLKEKADFFDQHAVIVGEDKYYYHTYDCPSRPGYFWIYNTEAAVGRGYHPCPTCNPPKPSN